MRWFFRLPHYWGMGGLLPLLLTALVHADPPPSATVPMAQAQCFQVQFLLRLPDLEALHFIQQVDSLRDVDADDTAANTARISDLSRQSITLRRDEAQTFTQLAHLLAVMSAPPTLRTWAAGEAVSLGKPVVLSKDEQQEAKMQPDTAAILATLDECDTMKTATEAHLSGLGTWLALTQGASGLWAANVGDVAAYLHSALPQNGRSPVAPSVARHLRDTAPVRTPAQALDALNLLIPKGGNLSALVPANDNVPNVPPETLTQAQNALIAAFQAQALIADTAPTTMGAKNATPN